MHAMVLSENAGELAGSSSSQLGAFLPWIQAPGPQPPVSAIVSAICLRNAACLPTGRLNLKNKLRLSNEAAY
jgi:hypothetical protein